jgi:hypothetical protein
VGGAATASSSSETTSRSIRSEATCICSTIPTATIKSAPDRDRCARATSCVILFLTRRAILMSRSLTSSSRSFRELHDLEEDVKDLDIKIALLVKNKITHEVARAQEQASEVPRLRLKMPE